MPIFRSPKIAGVGLLLVICSCSIFSDERQGVDPTVFLGGPTSIPAQIEAQDDDSDATVFDRLESEHNLLLTADYASMYQTASDVISGDNYGTSGVFRIYGTWTLVDRGPRNKGSIVFKGEHRHAYDDTAPADLASNVGFLGVNAIGFTDVGDFVGPLYWQQYFSDGQIGVVAGRVDPLDFVDVLGVGSQWTSFQNGATLANLALPLPDLGCGGGAGRTFNDQWIVGFTAHDLNGSQTDLDCFSDGFESYKQAFIGWSPSRAQRFSQAIVLTAWHSDAQDDGPDSGQGVALSSNWTIKEQWMPFVRVGVSDGEAAIMESQLSAGLTYTFGRYRNQIGTAVSYQNPAFAGLTKQTILETYVRWHVTKSLAISPNIQVYWNPSLNSTESKIAMYGFRIRYTP